MKIHQRKVSLACRNYVKRSLQIRGQTDDLMAGLVEKTGLRADVLSYEAPTYYGMIVATYQPA